MMRIGYVCTNYNNSSFTLEAVKSLKTNAAHHYRIVVVDNNSDAENVAQLREMGSVHSDVHLILSEDNVGYFRGLNLGIRYLREQYPDLQWMIVGNNDLVFPADFADKLALLSPLLSAHAVVSPDIVTVEGEHQNPHVISSISKLRELFYDLYYANYYLGVVMMRLAKMFPSLSERSDEEHWQVARSIYQGHGACYILGPRFFEQFAELWAPTFMMSEEYFLSKQLSDLGQQVYYEPGIQVVHHWHGSLAKLPSRRRWNLAREAHREYRKYIRILS